MIGTPQTEFNNVAAADEAELMQMHAISMNFSRFEFALSPYQATGGWEREYAGRTLILARVRAQMRGCVRTSRKRGM